ncbi:hypothetical protein K0M31_020216 [Melipona bicolor]|uniref:PH domain-containing protein n=1 Tax=Melipona bicolor TaxID=60889 RepID=A0AA40KQJ2_9HYME|nr:hypothetical protein K0M31_020216 [Melipona bicolor]
MGGPPSGMAGKDGKVEPKSGDVVRQGFMVKRSQNKKRFTPVNYKQRWFVLTRRYLVYYDGDGETNKIDKQKVPSPCKQTVFAARPRTPMQFARFCENNSREKGRWLK